MNKIYFKFLISILCFTLFSGSVMAQEKEKLSRFLNSCLYGTATGVVLGVVSLAFANDPGSSMNNIARGASLGLYAGIGIGLYTYEQDSPVLTFIPKFHSNQVEGAGFVLTLNSF